MVEGSTHYCRVNPVLVGESAMSRKGTAQDRVNAILSNLDTEWFYKCLAAGLSSGEGLIHHVRDRRTETKIDKNTGDEVEIVVDAGVDDKRLLVVESEFAQPLIMMQREGNSLSTVLRNTWDDKVLRTLTKNSPDRATGSHITICGHITSEELAKHVTTKKLGGGVGNRFLFLLVRKSKLLPMGGGKTHLPGDLVGRLQKAAAFGRNHRHIMLSTEPEPGYHHQSAVDLWRAVYKDLSRGAPGLFGTVISRAEAHVRRLATLYAVIECSPEVKIRHLFAALSLWDYARQSSYIIFKDRSGDEFVDRLWFFLEDGGAAGRSRNDILDRFDRNVPSAVITTALRQLEENGRARMEKIKGEGRGRPQERWFAC